MGVECSTHRNSEYIIFVIKTGGKSPPGKPRNRWEDSIRMNLTVIEWEAVD
jgi:hypothetical protein